MHYSLFQYFLLMCYDPYTLVENSKYFCVLVVNFFCKIKFITGEPTHTASKEINDAACPQLLIIVWKVKYPLHFFVSYVQPITQHCESRTVRKAPLQSK